MTPFQIELGVYLLTPIFAAIGWIIIWRRDIADEALDRAEKEEDKDMMKKRRPF